MKIGDIVRTVHDEKCYVIAVNDEAQTATLFSVVPGHYQAMTHSFEDLKIEHTAEELKERKLLRDQRAKQNQIG